MKATIERATLLKSLGHVQSVVERRNTIPILSNVLIEASGDPVSGASGLKLMATDLDLQIVDLAAAHVDQPGARSEEHTSELQSLMRISYAVFCLKKKKKER